MLSPLRPAVDRLRDELAHRQELSASATQESLEALAAGTRLSAGIGAGARGRPARRRERTHAAGELALLRAAALGAVAASGARARRCAVGEGVGGDLAALGIEAADPAGAGR